MKNTVMMVGFYDDFARFYCEISSKYHGPTVHVFLNFSGFLYSLVNCRNNRVSCYLLFPAGFFLSVQKGSDCYELSEHELDYILEYPRKVTSIERRLCKRAYRYWHKFIEKNAISTIIIAGDSRPISRLFKTIGQRAGLKVLYFEQGPCGTTILDTKGVNANASFRYARPKLRSAAPISARSRAIAHKRNPAYRAVDYILDFFLLSWAFPAFSEGNIQQLIRSRLASWSTKMSRSRDVGFTYDDAFALLVLQVPNDANMVLHSPLFESFDSILREVFSNLPEDMSLVVREHPLYRNANSNDFYKTVQREPRIYLDSEKSLEFQIDAAQVVIVNNSTVGYESLMRNAKVLVLGDCYYDQCDFLVKLSAVDKLQEGLKSAMTMVNRAEQVEKFVAWSFENNFIQGHFRDADLTVLCRNILAKL